MGFPGHSHEDLFLICDIRATLPFPRERRFFFDPPWNPGRQVLVHPQPDDLWRIDWQVPSGTDVEAERASGALDRRIRQVVGRTTPYELAWVTAYRFHQRLAPRFRVGRVLLAGDAAHLMSPFGARGLNSGAADAENLAWKLALVLGGRAPGGAARQLRRRAPRGGSREPGRHRRQHAVHGPARAAATRRPQRHPARQRAVRDPAPARQLRATVAAVHLRALAGGGTAARGRAPAGARLGGAGWALHPARSGSGMWRACAT